MKLMTDTVKLLFFFVYDVCLFYIFFYTIRTVLCASKWKGDVRCFNVNIYYHDNNSESQYMVIVLDLYHNRY